MCLFQFSTCFEQPRAHHQENQLYQYNIWYTGCPRRNVSNFGRVFLMLNYTDITQNTYIQIWTVTEITAIEKCRLLGCPRDVRRPWRHTHPTAHARQQAIVMQCPWRRLYSTVALTSQDNSQLRPVWSTWKPKDKYDSIASVFVAQFNGFVTHKLLWC